MKIQSKSDYSVFYDEKRDESYLSNHKKLTAVESSNYGPLKSFIDKFDLYHKKCLEIGSSFGFFQDMVENYFGTDIAESLTNYYHRPYKVAKGKSYPYDDAEFDAIWSFNVYEHIPHLQEALSEISRLLKPGGVVLFQPAWYCRSWTSEGYNVRPYSDFKLKGKIIKATIPLRNSILWRSLLIFPKRLFRHILFILGYQFRSIRYKKLNPNYQIYWTSDADACNSIDPHDAFLWFLSNNFECVSHPSFTKALFVRTGGLIFRKLV